MAKRNLQDKLVSREQIKEEISLIDDTDIEYVTPSGKIYTDYGNNKFFPKATFINKTNGYLYCNLKHKDGKMKQHRVHVLVAKAFIPNPNNYPYVCHKDNNKSNPNIDNLEWGTASKNTKDAFADGLAHNAKGYEDNQSIPVYAFDLNYKLIADYGSVSEAAKALNVTKTGILYQCNHLMRTKPRKGYYFLYQDDYNKNGFYL